MAINFELEDFDDILDHWQNKNPSRFRIEGEAGVRNLEQLVKDIGYDQGIEEFLSDNPGAIEKLIDWISDTAEKGGIDWKETLAEKCDYTVEDHKQMCIDDGNHLISCEDDGYCDNCGYQ